MCMCIYIYILSPKGGLRQRPLVRSARHGPDKGDYCYYYYDKGIVTIITTNTVIAVITIITIIIIITTTINGPDKGDLY